MIRTLYMVELTVADWGGSLAWYRDVLGLALLLQDPAGCFALFQAGEGRIALKAGTPVPGTMLLTLEVDDLAGRVEHLSKQGATIEEAIKISPEGYRRAIIRDPDGYRLSLFEWLGTES
jgi:predicted enzyme related to lactoylglutathione lyase